MCKTADDPVAAGHSVSLLAGHGGSAKAQGTIVATTLELGRFGFSDDDIAMLLKDKHASFDCQKALLFAVKCFRSDTHIDNRTIVKLLRGDSYSSTERLRSLGEVIVKLMKMGIKDEQHALSCIIGKTGNMTTRLGRADALFAKESAKQNKLH